MSVLVYGSKDISVKMLSQDITPFLSPAGKVFVYSGIIIVLDESENITKMRRLCEALDTPFTQIKQFIL